MIKYVVLSYRRWDSLQLDTPLFKNTKLEQPNSGSTGFIPVFDTKEEAEEYSEGKFLIAPIKVG